MTYIEPEQVLLFEENNDMPHPRWNTVKQVKEALSKFNDDDLVFIEPHKFMIDYPFYIYKVGDQVIFRFYDDSLLRRRFADWVESIKERLKGIIRKVKHETQ